jgi:LacI family transcriptional regulator
MPSLSRPKPPTILDVARRAGVSKSTVSNVVRGLKAIAPETRSRVSDAIQELGYRPNVLARQLVQQRTTIFGVIVGDFANPFHAEMVKEVEHHADRHGYRTMFVNTREEESAELAAIESLLEHRVAGLIFLAYPGASERVRALVEGRVPSVFLTCRSEWGDIVSGNDRQAAAAATRYLIDLGHRSIAYLADPIVEDAADRARQSGYESAMREAGLRANVFHWRPGHAGVLRGRREAPLEQALNDRVRVTGIVSSNDLGAIELLDCADRLGIRVPEDLSVIGFDDVAIAGLARINLTTVAQPQSALAELALATLAARVEGDLKGPPVERIVELQLIVRGTTAPPPQG